MAPDRRDFMKTVPAIGAAFAVSPTFLSEEAAAQTTSTAAPLEGHFHPKGKAPSEHTLKILAEAKETLPFSDTQDFEEVAKGFIAQMPEPQIMADAGNVAWDRGAFDFIDEQDEYDSIHPSLMRISKLNQNYGLYEVIPGIYQVRGFDLSDISFVRGKTGWIAIDPLVSAETARAAWDLFSEHKGEGLPITAVIYSHSHGDHWGGVRGIVSQEDVDSGKVEIIASRDFMEHTISENVFAGNAMNRRLFYQYGLLLPVAPHGFVNQGLGKRVSAGAVGLIAPTRIVEDDIEEFEVDGVRMIFQNTPNTEAPSEMNTYIPDMKALWMAENVTATLHNIYTLRGAPVRDALRWSKYISRALFLFGQEAEVMFASHHWPRWGNDRVQQVLKDQRDLYAHMNNQTLHLANQGVTINQIHHHYEPSQGLQQTWHTRGYHGSPQHNSRGVVQRFLGFWDCNPATLIPLEPEASAPLYVEMMGGKDPTMAKGLELHNAGQYFEASEILNKLFLSDPSDQEVKDLLADVYEQLGYQQENPGLRNSFLSGAYELRSGIPTGETADTSSPEVIRAMSTELFLDFLAIKMDSRKAEGIEFTMNLSTPDNGEMFAIELAKATLTNVEGFAFDEPDLTLTLNRSDLELVMTGEADFEDLLADGRATADGDVSVLIKLAGAMIEFDPLFEVLPGTSTGPTEVAEAEPLQAVTGQVVIE
ncbi:MBL fold metallo-hydrolase [Ruegeria sp. R13_0]|uniref:alkyl/aryl-sulfatase n=1 Tax=Ruegeria sp. R13_0 TaxID=2821099 RepID=UPI001ADD0C4A|nr:alkyl sulfatase dimerization domain-containing protein [Ruegeria sp. R13_0]MBO9433588.1 MBL fold metallo-hydrolase [Ruegeria sp. R13_0]